jgi:fructose-1-phosphate kinase PfkB-like protein
VSGRFPVGSGDSFLGGLVAELDQQSDLRSALTTATAAGVANALIAGPANFRRSDVDRLRPLVRLPAAGA